MQVNSRLKILERKYGNMEIEIIYCDLDDVIVDFTNAALAIHGWCPEKFEALRKPGRWGMLTPMKMSLAEFWKPIHEKGEDFWLGLEFLPWAHDLIQLLNRSTNWGLITDDSCHVVNHVGKAKFIHREFSQRVVSNSHITGQKYRLAQGALLIDDREENVDRFIAAGGQGIVFPSRGNDLFQMAADPVRYVQKMLEVKRCI